MFKYICPFTDFGFKKIFGEEANKELLIDFLNEVLAGENHIKELSYKPTEKLARNIYDRNAIFDLYCENEKGEKFIIELQKAKQKYFKDRSVFYSTFPIQEQAKKGEWDYKLVSVYTIGILDFRFDEDKTNKFKVMVKLKDDENSVFYDKLTFIYLQLVNFNKTEKELKTNFDKWLYLLKHLGELDSMPKRFKNKIFSKLFSVAEVANLSEKDYAQYFENWKVYNDNLNVFNTAVSENKEAGIKEGIEIGIEIGVEKGIEIGVEKGIEIGVKEEMKKGEKKMKEKTRDIAKSLKAEGVSIDIIIKITGLTEEEIDKL